MSLSSRSGSFDSFADFYGASQYSRFDQELRCAGSFDLSVLDVQQEAIESSDPAISEFPIVTCKGGGGAGEFDFGDGWRKRDFRPGFVDVQPANQPCGFRIPDLDLTILFVKAEQLARCLEDTGFNPLDLCVNRGAFETQPTAADLVHQIWTASRVQDPGRNLIVDGLFLQLIGGLLPSSGTKSMLAPTRAIGDVRLKRVLDYIDDHLSDPLSMKDLADVACMSVSHFARSFRAAIGRPAWSYVQERRCCHAHDMIVRTKLPLVVIAAKCGFSNQAYFTTVFKRIFGCTPGALRS